MFDLFKERQNIDSLEHGFDTYKVRDSHIDIFFVLIKLLIRIFDITVLFQKNDKELQFAKKCPCYEKISSQLKRHSFILRSVNKNDWISKWKKRLIDSFLLIKIISESGCIAKLKSKEKMLFFINNFFRVLLLKTPVM